MKLETLFGNYSGLSSLIEKNLYEEAKNADKAFIYIFVINWLIVAFVTSLTYDAYLLGIVGGAVLTGLAFFAYKFFPGTSASRIIIGVLIMGFPIIMIQQHLGRIEMHFHIFVVLAFMSLYKDVLPTIASALTIAVHHLLFTYLQLSDASFAGVKIIIYNYACGWDLAFLHAAFVIVEAAVLIYMVYMIINQYLNSMQIMENVNSITENHDFTISLKQETVQEKAFHAFITSLRNVLNTAKTSAMQTTDITDKIHHVTTALSQSSSKQQSSISEITENSTLMQEELHQTSKDSSYAKERIDEANKNLQDIGERIMQFTQNIEQTAEIENSMSEKLNELTQSAEEIKSILTVISDIADQTNLLALNAAIEAARAGEHGRGFAVVADEVRKLAERTQKSLNEIHGTVNIVVQAINDTSENMTSNAENITHLSSDSLEVRSSLEKTIEIMDETAGLSKNSARNFSENIIKLESLVKTIHDVEALTTDSFSSIEEIVETIDSLVANAQQLNQELNIYKT
jgi:methyl-accepting chemotaxis protein